MLRHLTLVATLSALFALLTAGCPLLPSGDFVTIPSTGGTGGSSGSGTATSAGGSGTQPTSDGLTTLFPGCQEPPEVDFWRAEVLRLVNEARADYAYDPLTRNEILEQQATQYACEMVHYDFFDHVNPATGTELSDRAAQFGYQYSWIGENLAGGQRTPQEVVTAWLDSPCHRQNLLHPAFTELGVGIRVGGTYGYYWVQEFGRPADTPPYTGPPFTVPGCD